MTAIPRRVVIVLLASTVILALFFGLRSSHASVSPLLSNLGSSLSAGDRAKHATAPIASALGNETAKAELGRASWKLFHTMMARFPDKPSQEEQDSLEAYVYLFAQLYPCGECAGHFQKILRKFPPQTSSRSSAAAWACSVHNVVNKSLKKELFDCTKIGDFYHCGCTDEAAEEAKKLGDEEKGAKPEPNTDAAAKGSLKPGPGGELSEDRKRLLKTSGRDLAMTEVNIDLSHLKKGAEAKNG